MLLLGQNSQRTCTGINRRAFLQIGGSSVLGLTCADLLRLKATQAGYQTGSARAVIFLWLWGGPSQLDTWDPKPNAPMEFRGPFALDAVARSRHAHRRIVSAHRRMDRSARRHSLAAFELQRSWRRRHRRADGEHVGQRQSGRPRRQREACGHASGRSWRGPRGFAGDAAVHGGRRSAAPGQAGHHRRRGRPYRRLVRSLPPRLRSRTRHADSRPATARQSFPRSAAKPPTTASGARSSPANIGYRQPAHHRRLSRPSPRPPDLARCSTHVRSFGRNAPNWRIAMAGRVSDNRVCWPGGWWSMACRSCR